MSTADKTSSTVKLDYPIKTSGDREVAEVTVNKPSSGALRGLALTDLLRMETNALQTILPRVTQPMLNKQDVEKIDPADLVQLGTAVVGFLVPKSEKADFQST